MVKEDLKAGKFCDREKAGGVEPPASSPPRSVGG
jgi:hypothetical protein